VWHPLLARRFTVVCADLRGYGRSGCPAFTPDHAPYAKRAMARDMVVVMERLGFPRFSVAGHDRGGRVAYRLALDHPGRVERLAVLDILPTGTVWERADARFALAYWPSSLLAQPAPLPERLIAAVPEAVVDEALAGWGSPATVFRPEVRAAYVEAGGPLALWRAWGDNVQGRALNAGYFFPEEIPQETADALDRFFACG
jgi:haloacetate dehalogenase